MSGSSANLMGGGSDAVKLLHAGAGDFECAGPTANNHSNCEETDLTIHTGSDID